LAKAEEHRGGIRWRRAASVADVERLIAEAHAAGVPALLDFTGPSCVNCQRMAKTVLRQTAVIRAWNSGVPIEIDTDAHADLARWQLDRFKTQDRPLYVRLAPGGGETRWNEFFAIDNAERMTAFMAFLSGGSGSDLGAASGWSSFILLAVLGGLITLIMPCTYPMIPFTVTFFAKQAAAGRRLAPLAAAYALGIMGCFIGLGLIITVLLGQNLATLAGSPWTNLVIAALFLVFGLSLIGVFFLRLPSGIENRLGGGRVGLLGALLMGLTFAVTAFTCTAPFAGAVLAQAITTGDVLRPILGMALYSGVIAVPFFLLALSPTLLRRLPRAGAWMGEFKVVGGVVELAAALKFLVIADVAWGWGLFGRTTVLSLWAACGLLLALYLLGRVRMPGDAPVTEVGPGRLLTALLFLAMGLGCLAGLAGAELGVIESFFPRD
jgi:thiol:disulfide interchange protein